MSTSTDSDAAPRTRPTRRRPVRWAGFDRPVGDSPWRMADLARFAIRVTLALIGIITAWAGASGTDTWRDQIIWVAIGVGMVVFVAASGVAWLLAGMAAVTGERTVLMARMRLQLQLADSSATAESTSGAHEQQVISGELVWAEGMRSVHRPTCDVVAGKRTVTVKRSAAQSRGLQMCRMCRP